MLSMKLDFYNNRFNGHLSPGLIDKFKAFGNNINIGPHLCMFYQYILIATIIFCTIHIYRCFFPQLLFFKSFFFILKITIFMYYVIIF